MSEAPAPKHPDSRHDGQPPRVTLHSSNPYTPFAFQAYCVHRTRGSLESSRRAFVANVAADPDVTLESESWIVHLRVRGGSAIATEPEGRVSALLHGELHDEFGESAESVARRFRVRGVRLLHDLNGSFALLLLDRDADRLLLATDRVSSRRVFSSTAQHGTWLTSELSYQPLDSHSLDPVGIGWCLSSSSCQTGRTPYAGVRVLEPAILHEVRSGGIVADPYWSHQLEPGDAGTDYDRLIGELAERLVAAVRRRAEGVEHLFMSLSGGYDSTAIAAIMKDVLGIDDMTTFSYVSREAYGKPRDFEDCDPTDKDSYVAQQTARTLGFRHRVVETFSGDLMAHLRLNARFTEGMGCGWSGADVWPQLQGELGSVPNPVLLVGDEYLGRSLPFQPKSAYQVVEMARLRRLNLPLGGREAFPDDLLDRMRDGLQEDVDRVLARQGSTEDLERLYDEFIHDQRNIYAILPWRENFAGRFGRVRNPLFDSDVLDYMRSVPTEARREKRLFLDAVRSLSPTFRAFKRSNREAYHPSYHRLIVREAALLRDWIHSSESRLDELIPPSFGLSLLETILDPARVRGSAAWGSEVIRRRLAKRVPGVRAPAEPIGLTSLFRRWAVIRMAMENRPRNHRTALAS